MLWLLLVPFMFWWCFIVLQVWDLAGTGVGFGSLYHKSLMSIATYCCVCSCCTASVYTGGAAKWSGISEGLQHTHCSTLPAHAVENVFWACTIFLGTKGFKTTMGTNYCTCLW